jgi:hypothetical protein
MSQKRWSSRIWLCETAIGAIILVAVAVIVGEFMSQIVIAEFFERPAPDCPAFEFWFAVALLVVGLSFLADGAMRKIIGP